MVVCRGQYDFFYLPIDYKNKCNLGYCFMNFLNAELTAECYEEFHNKRWEEFNSKKARGAVPTMHQEIGRALSCSACCISGNGLYWWDPFAAAPACAVPR